MYIIVPSAGIGSRMDSKIPKQYLKLKNNKTILENTILNLLKTNLFTKIIIPLHPQDKFYKSIEILNNPKIILCQGGDERFLSVLNGLKKIPPSNENDFILVHDVARPYIKKEWIINLQKSVLEQNIIGAILVEKVTQTVKKVKNNYIEATLNRDEIFLAQTPQIFQANILKESILYCIEKKIFVTDESSSIENYLKIKNLQNKKIKSCQGSNKNIKITYKNDLDLINSFLF